MMWGAGPLRRADGSQPRVAVGSPESEGRLVNRPATAVFERAAPLLSLFVGLSFGIAWLLWLLAWAEAPRGIGDAWLTAIVIGGSFAPFVAAGGCVMVAEGWKEALRFHARSFNHKWVGSSFSSRCSWRH